MDDCNLREAQSHTEVVKLSVKTQKSFNRCEKVCMILVTGSWVSYFAVEHHKKRAAFLEECQPQNIIQHSMVLHLHL